MLGLLVLVAWVGSGEAQLTFSSGWNKRGNPDKAPVCGPAKVAALERLLKVHTPKLHSRS